MKSLYLTLSIFFLLSFDGSAQSTRIDQNFSSVRTLLTGWDQIRGEWLTSSFVAMSNNQPIPERTFPEMLTPAQLFSFVPQDTRVQVTDLLNENERVETETRVTNLTRGNNIFRNMILFALSSSMRTSWIFGEPHIVTFDNKHYLNLKTGEFILAKSNTSTFEVQGRFENIEEGASFTTAVSMNVGGDKVSIYANDKPDNISYNALRINGEAMTLNNPVYYLPMGGSITYANSSYTINWASGESVIVRFNNYQDKNYLNVAIQVYADDESDYSGLSSGSIDLSDEARFNAARVNAESSLFQYAASRSIESYSRPVHNKKLAKPSGQEETDARAICEKAGVTGPELEGCIYDYVHFGISPSVRPVFVLATDQLTLKPLNEAVVNNNETVGKLNVSNVPQPEETQPTRNKPDRNINEGFFINIIRVAPSVIGSVGTGIRIN